MSEWGNPFRVMPNHPFNVMFYGSIPGEVKHLSTQRKRNRRDPLCSGERKGGSPNQLYAGVVGIIHLNFELALTKLKI